MNCLHLYLTVFGLWTRFGWINGLLSWIAGLSVLFYYLAGVSGIKGKSTSSKSDYSCSTISTAHMEAVVQRLLGQQNRPSTVKTYMNIWRQFNKFVISLDIPPKSWEARTTLFIAHLIEQGKQSASVKSYVSAIKKMVVTDGYKWQDNEV